MSENTQINCKLFLLKNRLLSKIAIKSWSMKHEKIFQRTVKHPVKFIVWGLQMQFFMFMLIYRIFKRIRGKSIPNLSKILIKDRLIEAID